MRVLMLFYTFVFGLLFGSFLNVVILRSPRGETVVWGRSHCMSCGADLHWYENIPLFSYLFLRGRCGHCGAKISLQYPIVEFLNGVLWLSAGIRFGYSFETLIYMLFFSLLLVLSVVDEKTYTVSNKGLCMILGLACLHAVCSGNYMDALLGGVSVGGFLFVIWLVLGGKGIGGGDVKLMVVSGALTGLCGVVSGFFIGCLSAIVVHSLRMRFSGRTSRLAFVPYLSFGLWCGCMWGIPLAKLFLSMYA